MSPYTCDNDFRTDALNPDKGKVRPGFTTTTGKELRLHENLRLYMRIDRFVLAFRDSNQRIESNLFLFNSIKSTLV